MKVFDPPVTYFEVSLCDEQELVEAPRGEELVSLGHDPHCGQLYRGQRQADGPSLEGEPGGEEAKSTWGGIGNKRYCGESACGASWEASLHV